MEYEKVTTFFSWQSDIQGQNTFIRTALGSATSNLENESLKIINEEATRNSAGSPDIVDTIIKKIKSSDIFIADITIVNAETGGNSRRMPNPNVMFELGFAVALLGWERIILLNNSKKSSIQDLPFDIRNNKVNSFSAKSFDDSEKGNVRSELQKDIKEIIVKNPSRKVEKTDEEIKKERDIRALKKALVKVNINSVIANIDDMPFRIPYEIDWYMEDLKQYVYYFLDVHDEEVKIKLSNIIDKYYEIYNKGAYYDSSKNSAILVSEKQKFCEQESKEIMQLKKDFFDALKELQQYLRDEYLEIDIYETNRIARNNFDKEHLIS